MRITNIKPSDMINTLIETINENLPKIGIEGKDIREGNTIILSQLKTFEKKYNTLAYELSENWIIRDRYGKPYAQNVHFSDYIVKCRKGYFLQETDWMKLNDLLNAICDKLDISCTIRSALIKIRGGKQDVWRQNYRKVLTQINRRIPLPKTELEIEV